MHWPPRLPEPDDERTQIAMLRLFYAQSGVSLAAAALLIVVHLGYAGGRVAAPLLAGVDGGLRGPAGPAHPLARRGAAAGRNHHVAHSATAWRRRAVGSAAATGLLWAAALAMAFHGGQPASQMYAAMLACITGVASINVMAPLPAAFLALMLPLAAMLAGLFVATGTWAGAYNGALALAGAALATSLLLRHTRLLHESHAMRFEREALLAETQAARSAQVRFLAAASHDLRQPVHALGLLAAQAEVELKGRRAAATAAQMQDMAQALDSLVETLLDISRLDGGTLVPRPRPVPLQALFDRLAPEFAVLADARGLQWRLRPTPLWVHCDEAQLERMLRNLLSNALTHTATGGVLLAARRRGESVGLFVWDTGPGIAPEHQARIFDEFVQLQNPGRDRRRGHGLGLSIVARLSRLLGHPVQLRSRPGRGSCFSVILPAAPPQAVAAEPAGAALALPLQGLRVAMVEDDEAVRVATASLLSAWGCQVWADAAAEPLLAQLGGQAHGLDRVISDWRLGQGDGLAAILELRRAAGAELPALLLSGETLPMAPDALAELAGAGITAARKPLPAAALRAWLSASAQQA